MTEPVFYQRLLLSWFLLAGAIFVVLLFIPAPYGRLVKSGWGPPIPNRLGWLLMEAPSAAGFAALFFLSPGPKGAPEWVFLLLWESHYLYRAFIYPFTLRGSRPSLLVAVVALGFIFNLGNAYLNARYLFAFSDGYPPGWLGEPLFLAGLALFVGGMAVNRQSDSILRSLRRPAETGYRIPYGGFFRWVSCPNYLGEIVQWCGWALVTWSLPGLAFALWTFANLAPRALAYHRWYRQQFPDYPAERTALFPRLRFKEKS